MKYEEFTKDGLINNPDSLDIFTKNMGIVIRSIEEGKAVADMKLAKEIENPIGSIHGGALFTLADIISGILVTSTGKKATTLESSIHFLKAAFLEKTKYVQATAYMRKSGKSICVVDVNIKDDKEELLATSTFSFFIL